MDPTRWEPSNPFPHFISSSPTLSPPTSPDPLVTPESSSHPQQKGKGPSIPVEIPSSGRVHDAQADLFSMSLDSAASYPGPSRPTLSPPATIQPELTSTLLKLTRSHNDLDDDTDVPHLCKGKARDRDGDIPPTLPPLTFPPMTFDICPSPSLIPGSGPSSYDSQCHPRVDHEGYSRSLAVVDVATVLPHASPRRRSFSIPPSLYPGYPIATSSAQARVEGGPSGDPDERSQKFSLSSSDRSQSQSLPSSPEVAMRVPVNLDVVDAGSCLAPWKREFKSRSKDKSRTGPHPYIISDRVGEKATNALPDCYPVSLPTRPVAEVHPHKANGRSYSDPFPFPRAFDVVSTDTADTFAPFPVVVPPNLFDGMLPRELRLRIFGFFVGIYEEDHDRRVREGRWTAIKASKHKWVGRDQGVRELMRLSRVST